jgi:hypothetical protein
LCSGSYKKDPTSGSYKKDVLQKGSLETNLELLGLIVGVSLLHFSSKSIVLSLVSEEN